MSNKRELEEIEELVKFAIQRINIAVATIDTTLARVTHILHLLLTPILRTGKVIIMPKTIAVGETAAATLALLDQNGKPMTIDATYTVAYSPAVPADVTVAAPNPDGGTTITGVNADAGDLIGAVVTRPDGVQVTLTGDTLTITAAVQTLTSGSVVLG